MNLGTAITAVMNSKSIEELENIEERTKLLVNKTNLLAFTNKLFIMCLKQNIDTDNFVVVQDLIDYQYLKETY